MSSVDHLRDFVNERLTAAAEEIFGLFRKTIVEYEEEIDRQRKLLGIFWKPQVKLRRIATEPPLSKSSVTAEEVLQEPSTQPTTQESNASTSEVRVSSKTTEHTKNDGNICYVFIDFKELGDESLKQEVLFPSSEGLNSKRGQPEKDMSYMQPVSSVCSADEERTQSERAQTKTKRRKVLKRQNGSVKQKGRARLADGDVSSPTVPSKIT